MNVTLIVAASTNDVIGRNGALPWHLPEDLRLFRELSLGKAVIMGRRTHEAIGRPLPGRRNIVISRQPDLQLDGCEVVGSPEAALALVEGDDEVMVIGGELVYRQFLPRANRLHLTRVHVTVEGDTFLPSLDTAEWRVAAEQDYPANDTRPLGFTFVTFERITATQD
ncbi:MAG TPA: dihydrofolate reductase [Woeseiaceae bacterium]|nr:dihydrofolate reductase [Woeseiaceae bacterium]